MSYRGFHRILAEHSLAVGPLSKSYGVKAAKELDFAVGRRKPGLGLRPPGFSSSTGQGDRGQQNKNRGPPRDYYFYLLPRSSTSMPGLLFPLQYDTAELQPLIVSPQFWIRLGGASTINPQNMNPASTTPRVCVPFRPRVPKASPFVKLRASATEKSMRVKNPPF